MRTTRRHLLATSGLLATAALAGCGVTGPAVDAQVLADAQGVVNVLQAVLPLVAKEFPQLVSQAVVTSAMSGLKLAQDLVSGLQTNAPALAAATTLHQVEGYVNQALQALASVTPELAATLPGLAPYATDLQMVAALVPGIEAFINATLAPVGTAPVAAKVASTVPPAQARLALKIPTVK